MARFAEYWEAGFTGIIPVIPPDAPLSAASKIKPEDRGKVPGRLNGHGTWGGFDWLHHETSEPEPGAWERMGASVGLRAGHCPGLDIDVVDAGLADLVESVAKRMLGPAPRRIGRAPKRLLAYRTPEPFGRMRLWFKRRTASALTWSSCSAMASSTWSTGSTPPPGSRTSGILIPP